MYNSLLYVLPETIVPLLSGRERINSVSRVCRLESFQWPTVGLAAHALGEFIPPPVTILAALGITWKLIERARKATIAVAPANSPTEAQNVQIHVSSKEGGNIFRTEKPRRGGGQPCSPSPWLPTCT